MGAGGYGDGFDAPADVVGGEPIDAVSTGEKELFHHKEQCHNVRSEEFEHEHPARVLAEDDLK